MADVEFNNGKVTASATQRGTRYTLWMLMLVYTFSFLDRQIVSILAQDIKVELGLSDSELGILTGLAFAVFYATLGIPLARLADKLNRVAIISACLTIWSLMTVASGLAGSFLQLALARMGVGVGEAGALPSSHSIIADTIPPEKRSSAMSIFQLGVPAGVLFGYLIGGWMNEWTGWRWAMVLVGAPGLLLAAIVYFSVPEPARGRFAKAKPATAAPLPLGFLRQVAELLSHPAYVYTGIAIALASMACYCIMAWTPAFLIRAHGLSTGILGTLLSLSIGLGSGIGTFYAGKLGDRSARRRADGPLRLCTWITLAAAPLFFFAFLAGDLTLTLALLIPGYVLFLSWMGPSWAMVQAASPERSRAMASALVLLVTNLVGLGLGPWLVGVLSDTYNRLGMAEPLGWALISSLVLYPLAALFFALAARAHKGGQRGETAA